MDINELKGQIESIASDDGSDHDCLLKFEKILGRIEEREGNYIDHAFLTIRTFFRNQLADIAREKADSNPAYAARLMDASRMIVSVSKADAPEIIRHARAKIRKEIPELRNEDRRKKIEDTILDEFSRWLAPDDLQLLLFHVYEGQHNRVFEIAKTLESEQKSRLYGLLSRLDPEDRVFAALYARHSIEASCAEDFLGYLEFLPTGPLRDTYIDVFALSLIKNARNGASGKKYFAKALALLEPSLDRIKSISLYAGLARRLPDRTAMNKVLPLLRDNLDDPFCLNEFGLICKKLGYTEHIAIVLHKMEQQKFTPAMLVTYSNLARAAKDKRRMEGAMQVLQGCTGDLYCLNTYASLAKDLENEEAMIEAFFLLGEHLDDPFCANTFATLARLLDDHDAMVYGMKKLEPYITDSPVCATTYAINALCAGTADELGIAQSALKYHLDTPKCLELYLEVADTPEQTGLGPKSFIRPRQKPAADPSVVSSGASETHPPEPNKQVA